MLLDNNNISNVSPNSPPNLSTGWGLSPPDTCQPVASFYSTNMALSVCKQIEKERQADAHQTCTTSSHKNLPTGLVISCKVRCYCCYCCCCFCRVIASLLAQFALARLLKERVRESERERKQKWGRQRLHTVKLVDILNKRSLFFARIFKENQRQKTTRARVPSSLFFIRLK
jgi:hypothetical protein